MYTFYQDFFQNSVYKQTGKTGNEMCRDPVFALYADSAR